MPKYSFYLFNYIPLSKTIFESISISRNSPLTRLKGETGRLIAIGGSAIDYQIKPKQDNFQLYKSCIGKTRRSLGGIARNIVDCSSKLGIQSVLISAIGNDRQSGMITQFCKKSQIELIKIEANGIEQQSSGKYYAILDKNNNQIMGISQMQINQILTYDHIHSKYLKNIKKQISKNDIVVIDSNVPEEELYKLVKFIAEQVGCMIVYECKGQKTKRVITSGAYSYISLLKMNFLQSKQIEKAVKNGQNQQKIDLNEWMLENLGSKNPFVSPIKTITTNGPDTIMILKSTLNKKVETLEIKTLKPKIIQKTTGAGDTFTGTYCSMVLMGKSYEEALKYALAGSKLNIQSVVNESVISDKISLGNLESIVKQELISI